MLEYEVTYEIDEACNTAVMTIVADRPCRGEVSIFIGDQKLDRATGLFVCLSVFF